MQQQQQQSNSDQHSPPPPAPNPSADCVNRHDSPLPRNDYMHHNYFGNAPPVPGADIPPPPPPPPPPQSTQHQQPACSVDENSTDVIHTSGEYQVAHNPNVTISTSMYHHHSSVLCNGGPPPLNGGGFSHYISHPPSSQHSSNQTDTEATEEEKHDDASSASSGASSDDPKPVEVSVVGSPTVFGMPPPAASITPESDDERVIERCDLGSDQLALPTADHRPPKKRFMHNAPDVPASRTSPSGVSAFGAVPGMFGDGVREEPGDLFQQAMCNWQWVSLDGIRMPVVLRERGDAYAAVHIVQLKFLSKFPPNIPVEMTTKYTMVSQKMTVMESWIFNTINAVMCKFDLGCQLFTTNDEIVRFADVERFYWAVKALNLRRIMETYEVEMRNTSPFNFALIATITQLKKTIEDDLEEVKTTLASMQSS